MIVINQLLHYSDVCERLDRVLWIDERYKIAYVINILNNKSLPEKRFIADLEKDLEESFAVIEREDPYFQLVDDSTLSDKEKSVRDERWNRIQDIVAIEPDIYISRPRGRILKEFVSMGNISYKELYKLLKIYWIRGMSINSLLPQFKNNGGKGKKRIAGDKKLGRPRANKEILGEGINVTNEIANIFRLSLEEFYLNTKENDLITAYDLMLKKYFSDKVQIDENEVRYTLRPISELPTIRQFRYWLDNNYNTKDLLLSRKGSRNFKLQHRAILGDSRNEALGSGSLYQIDATIADVYLVSRYNRNHIIGRPVVYIVIDVFSRMITGVYCGLEGPSWSGAMMALANAASDKVAFCKEYGIDISKEDWDTAYIPEAILGDRGELEGKNAESLIESLNIKIQNTPPYRGDWKGIIEQQFKLMHGKIKPFVPGFVKKDFMTRTGHDYRFDAKLDLYQFTKIIINCVLFHNNHHWLEYYDFDEFSIGDEVLPIPKELWNWGIKNRSGKLRVVSEEMLKINLMPTDTASVTYRGVKYHNMFYSCETAMREHWFEKARQKGSWKVSIAFDPRNMNYIYIKNLDKTFEPCFLLESKSQYKDKTIYEIDYEEQLLKTQHSKHIHKEKENKINLYANIENIVNEGVTETNKNTSMEISNRQKILGIKRNRKIEKALNREEESFVLVNDNPEKADVIDLDFNKGTDIVEESETNLLSLLKKKQKEGMNNGK